MPSSVVKTPREERLWEKAKERAEEQGHKDNWAYIMGIYKRMNPARFDKAASASRVASRYLNAYQPGGQVNVGWEPGQRRKMEPTPGTGSHTPPARDQDGRVIELGELPPMDIPGYGKIR